MRNETQQLSDNVGFRSSTQPTQLVAVGGMANLWGVLIMGVSLTFLSLRGVFGSFDDAVFGAILIAVMLFAPDGILSIRGKAVLARLKRTTDGDGGNSKEVNK